MKNVLIIILCLFVTKLYSQNVGINTNNVKSNLLVEINSLNGVLIPRLDSIEIYNIGDSISNLGNIVSNEYNGLLVYNSSNSSFNMWKSSLNTYLHGGWSQILDNKDAQEYPGSVGVVKSFAFDEIPNGYLACNGQEVSRVVYSNLFNVIGVTYGSGDGVNTFNLPNFNGMFLRGHDNSRGVDSEASNRLARADGIGGDNLGSWQLDTFELHSHTVDYPLIYSTGFSHNHNIARPTDRNGYPDGASDSYSGSSTNRRYWRGNKYLYTWYFGTNTYYVNYTLTSESGGHNHVWDPVAFNSNITNSAESCPINMSVNYCIKY